LRNREELSDIKEQLSTANTRNEQLLAKQEKKMHMIELQHRETMSKCSDLELEKAQMQRFLHELQSESEQMKEQLAHKSANRKSMAQSRVGLDSADLEYLLALEEEVDIITTERDQLQAKIADLEAASNRPPPKPPAVQSRDSFATTASGDSGKDKAPETVIEAAGPGDTEQLRIMTIQNRNLREELESREIQLEQLISVIEGFEVREKELELKNSTLSDQLQSLQSDANKTEEQLNEAKEEYHVISKQYEDYKTIMKDTCQEYEAALASEQKTREELEAELNTVKSQGKLTGLSGLKTTRNPPPPPAGTSTSESAPPTPAKLTLAEMRKARDLRKAK